MRKLCLIYLLTAALALTACGPGSRQPDARPNTEPDNARTADPLVARSDGFEFLGAAWGMDPGELQALPALEGLLEANSSPTESYYYIDLAADGHTEHVSFLFHEDALIQVNRILLESDADLDEQPAYTEAQRTALHDQIVEALRAEFEIVDEAQANVGVVLLTGDAIIRTVRYEEGSAPGLVGVFYRDLAYDRGLSAVGEPMPYSPMLDPATASLWPFSPSGFSYMGATWGMHADELRALPGMEALREEDSGEWSAALTMWVDWNGTDARLRFLFRRDWLVQVSVVLVHDDEGENADAVPRRTELTTELHEAMLETARAHPGAAREAASENTVLVEAGDALIRVSYFEMEDAPLLATLSYRSTDFDLALLPGESIPPWHLEFDED